MSAKLMGEQWRYELRFAERLVLLSLADHADKTGISFPSIGLIAWETGLGERAVQKIMRPLRKSGVLVPIANERGGQDRGGHGKSTKYRINWNPLKLKEPRKKGEPAFTHSPGEKTAKGEPRFAKRVNPGSPMGEPARSPEPSLTKNKNRNTAPDGASVTGSLSQNGEQQNMQKPIESAEKTESSCSPPRKNNTAPLDTCEWYFRYFTKQTDKDSDRYTLTAKRRKQFEARLGEAQAMAKRELPNAPEKEVRKRARLIVADAIDALAGSDFHMQKGFDGWEQVFGSPESFEEWLHRFTIPEFGKVEPPKKRGEE